VINRFPPGQIGFCFLNIAPVWSKQGIFYSIRLYGVFSKFGRSKVRQVRRACGEGRSESIPQLRWSAPCEGEAQCAAAAPLPTSPRVLKHRSATRRDDVSDAIHPANDLDWGGFNELGWNEFNKLGLAIRFILLILSNRVGWGGVGSM